MHSATHDDTETSVFLCNDPPRVGDKKKIPKHRNYISLLKQLEVAMSLEHMCLESERSVTIKTHPEIFRSSI